MNVFTGSYAALLNHDDRSEVVNITFRLNGDDDPGSAVCIPYRPDCHRLTNDNTKWQITHLRRDEYKIQNVDFKSFASYDNGPMVEDPVLGKSKAISWTVRLVQGPNTYK